MSEIFRFYSEIDRAMVRDVVMTLLFLLTLIIARVMIRKAILHRSSLQPEVKQRWLGNIRNLALLISALGIMMIWGNELENFAVSLVAVAAAFVLATREMLLCILGSVLRTSTDMCRIGDRIEINGIKGQVIDMNLLSTILVESSQSCFAKNTVGRVVTLPNSLFFSQAIYNENRLGNFVMHTIHLKLERDDNWQLAERILLEAGNDVIDEYADKLARNARAVPHLYALESNIQQLQTRILLDDINYVTLHLQLPVPIGKAYEIEQRVLREYLSKMPPTTNYRTYANRSRQV